MFSKKKLVQPPHLSLGIKTHPLYPMKNIHSKKNPGCMRPWGFVMIFRGAMTWRFRVSARQPTGRTVPKPPHLPDVVTKTQQNGVEKTGEMFVWPAMYYKRYLFYFLV